MLRDAALLQLELNRRALREDLTLKDASPYNVQWRGAAPGVHRRRLVRAPAPGRAVGGLPAVLHALPLSADAAGLQGPAVSRAAARVARRHPAAHAARRAVAARPLPQGRVLERRCCTRAWRPATRPRRGARSSASCGAPASTRSCSTPRSASWRSSCAGSSGRSGETAWTGYGEDNTYDDEAPAARRRSCARPPRAGAARLTWDLGCNDGTYARVAAESRRHRRRRRRGPRHRRRALPPPARRAARRTSCRSS